jgi:hypothetical protein
MAASMTGIRILKTLAEACQKTGWQIHAYCLMTNHYRLVVETNFVSHPHATHAIGIICPRRVVGVKESGMA